ncbi:MAG: aldolase/citrate lyase family protein [Pirellulales bacterium]
MVGTFRSRLAAGERLLGTMVTLPCAATAEILADVGFDWLFIDGEHGPFELSDIADILRAVGERVACVVRVPAAAEVPIKRVLDLGAEGIICPQVNTADVAANVVRWARYAPDGLRGVGLGRAHGYGTRFSDYVSVANDRVAVIVQAEHALAVENIDAIAATRGVDAVLLGPTISRPAITRWERSTTRRSSGRIDRITAACRGDEDAAGLFRRHRRRRATVHRIVAIS